jgi:signal transduction histidine kinase
VLLLITAVGAIWLLQRVLSDLHAHQQHELADSFQWIVLGLSGAFVILINTSIVILLRMGRMILRPVDKLVAGTKALAGERFGYRVPVDEGGEFDELARAFNGLAERLAANEQRKIEMLGQVSIAMNHELNNVASIIELHLGLLARQKGASAPAIERPLREIHQSLKRITATVQSLKNVRRIVLTDYVPGMKMLDLQRSIAPEEALVDEKISVRVTTPARTTAPELLN